MWLHIERIYMYVCIYIYWIVNALHVVSVLVVF